MTGGQRDRMEKPFPAFSFSSSFRAINGYEQKWISDGHSPKGTHGDVHVNLSFKWNLF
jgi:hypothetical protein